MSDKQKSFAKVSEHVVKLEGVLTSIINESSLPLLVTFNELQLYSGVEMDHRGRAHLRRACRRQGIVYSAVPGKGIMLADAGLAVEETTRKVRLIGSAAKRAARTFRDTVRSFGAAIPMDRRVELELAHAKLGAIASLAQSAKALGSGDAENVLSLPGLSELKAGAIRAIGPVAANA